jgi:sortase A
MSYKPTKIINYLLIALGLVALFFIWQTDTTTQQTALSDNTGLGINQDNTPSDLSEDKENQEEIQNNIKQSDYRIVISSIGVDMAIILGDDEKNALLQGAWHIPGSGTPDDTDGYKNIVISGHRYLYTSGPNTFFNLDKIQTEDIIQIFWQNQEYKYQVNKIHIVEPNEISILEDTGQEKLTLFTCHPVYTTDQRLVIEALPI